ncbi:MAG TPA: hypothetical protein VGD74_01220 [Vulgatibacter sp.]
MKPARPTTDAASADTAGQSSNSVPTALRSFDFEKLAVVLFDPAYRVRRAVLLPRALVEGQSYVSGRTNARTFYATDEVFSAPGAEDITSDVRAAAAALDEPCAFAGG